MGNHIGNAVWLLRALPGWYFSQAPFSAAESLCLVVGVVLGISRRRLDPLLFLTPVLLSECYVAVAGWFRGQLCGSSPLAWTVEGGFLLAQLCLIFLLVYRLKGARLAASGLALFRISYALFAALVGGIPR